MFAFNNCSKKYMKIYILLLLLFYFALSSCTQIGSTSENSQSDNMNTTDSEKTVTNSTNTTDSEKTITNSTNTIDNEKTITNKSIDVTNSPDINNLGRHEFFVPFDNYQLKDFPDNNSLNLIENEKVKKNVINVILYIYNYDLDINTIEMGEDESKEWFSRFSYYEVGWSISQQLDRFAKRREDLIVMAIDANFMMKLQNLLEKDILSIIVSVYQSDIPMRMNYTLYLKKIDRTYKLIGITADA